MLFLLFGVEDQRTELSCVLAEEEDGFLATSFERGETLFERTERDLCFSFGGSED